jgi:penicillin-binding protein 2
MDKAREQLSTDKLIETTRGRLLDRKGQVIAEDAPCIDACVDYRALLPVPDPTWMRSVAVARLRARSDYLAAERPKRNAMILDEIERVRADIDAMWNVLARHGSRTVEEIHETRRNIVRKVEMMRRVVWYRKYAKEMADHGQRDAAPWYQRWLVDESAQAPELDQFYISVGEERQPHVILPDISNESNNFLAKNQESFPGLVLRRGTRRTYPFHESAAHIIGRMGQVNQAELSEVANSADALRRYWRNDLIGRSGLEALAEPALRGVRGRVKVSLQDDSGELEREDPIPGVDVKTTLDIDLQGSIQQIFKRIEIRHAAVPPKQAWIEHLEMPGAAVVIDVPSGEVIAMASYPSFDLDSYDQNQEALESDLINRPTINRATQAALEPGSTVKPMVGLSAITQGLFPADGTIECTGYLIINGRTYTTMGRCWTMSMYGIGHHHTAGGEHPTGFLTFDDALERSCNVFFETLADKLQIRGLHTWYDRFGLGRPTGVGLPERSGKIPGTDPLQPSLVRSATWFSGIGQGQVLTTPIQMANAVATIARNGVWVRPHLVSPETKINDPHPEIPASVDLHLSPEGLRRAHEGMGRVVSSEGGTGTILKGYDVAGKTGSAQASPLTIPLRDESGDLVYEEKSVPRINGNGQISMETVRVQKYEKLEMGTIEKPNPRAPWYRGFGDKEDKRSHAWYIGFAPAKNPKIAFAVMVEYGGSGGVTAGYVAKCVLDACIEHGYLPKHDR